MKPTKMSMGVAEQKWRVVGINTISQERCVLSRRPLGRYQAHETARRLTLDRGDLKHLQIRVEEIPAHEVASR